MLSNTGSTESVVKYVVYRLSTIAAIFVLDLLDNDESGPTAHRCNSPVQWSVFLMGVYSDTTQPDMAVGWVHPSVGLGWVGSEIFACEMGWVGFSYQKLIFFSLS